MEGRCLHAAECVLVELKVRFTFDSQTQGSFVVESGGGLAPDGHAETVKLDLRRIRDGLYLNRRTDSDQLVLDALR